MVFDRLFRGKRKPKVSTQELATRLFEWYEDYRPRLLETGASVMELATAEYDQERLEWAVQGLWAFAAFWGVWSSTGDAEPGHQVATETVLEWTRARAKRGEDWEEANEVVVELFNALSENERLPDEDKELGAAKRVFHGWLFVSTVLGEEVYESRSVDAGLQAYNWLFELAEGMTEVVNTFELVSS